MDNSIKHDVNGTIQLVKGKIEEAAGKLVGNPLLEAHGLVDQAAGKAQQVVAKVESKLEDAAAAKSDAPINLHITK